MLRARGRVQREGFMKTSHAAGVLLLKALILGACAASPSQGAQVRVHTRTAAFEQHASSHAASAPDSARPARKESPLAHACKTGSSRSCNEIGDRLAVKHAYAEAMQWYGTACDRARGAMVPTAARLLELSRDLTQQATSAAKKAELRSDASEIRARIQGCFDAGEMQRAVEEPKQALTYYEAVCEFSMLVEVVGETVPGLEHVTASGCAAGDATRAKLSKGPFSPQLFAEVLEQQQKAPAPADADMVFTMGEL